MAPCHDMEYWREMIAEARQEARDAALFDRRPRWPVTDPNDPDFEPDEDTEEGEET